MTLPFTQPVAQKPPTWMVGPREMTSPNRGVSPAVFPSSQAVDSSPPGASLLVYPTPKPANAYGSFERKLNFHMFIGEPTINPVPSVHRDPGVQQPEAEVQHPWPNG